jgi:hypothetical protein
MTPSQLHLRRIGFQERARKVCGRQTYYYYDKNEKAVKQRHEEVNYYYIVEPWSNLEQCRQMDFLPLMPFQRKFMISCVHSAHFVQLPSQVLCEVLESLELQPMEL